MRSSSPFQPPNSRLSIFPLPLLSINSIAISDMIRRTQYPPLIYFQTLHNKLNIIENTYSGLAYFENTYFEGVLFFAI